MDPVDWNELRLRVGACTQCEIRFRCKQPVFGDGSVSAPIFLIGEAPGETEDRLNLPFVGPAGQILKDSLIEAGFTEKYIFVTNVLKCRPPENRPPEKQEVRNCSLFLLKQLEYVNPLLVVTLGAVAFQTICGTNKQISKARGELHRGLGRVVLPTWHPSFVLRSKSELNRNELVTDLEKAKAYVDERIAKSADRSEELERGRAEEAE